MTERSEIVSNVRNDPRDEIWELLAIGGGNYHDITLPLSLTRRLLKFHKEHHSIPKQWHAMIADILIDAEALTESYLEGIRMELGALKKIEYDDYYEPVGVSVSVTNINRVFDKHVLALRERFTPQIAEAKA